MKIDDKDLNLGPGTSSLALETPKGSLSVSSSAYIMGTDVLTLSEVL